MSKTVVVQARMEPALKKKAEAVIKKLGLSASQVVNALYAQIVMQKGVPFDLKIPNETTRKAIEEARKGKGVVRCNDADDFFDKLDI